jgi:hypothetical protein
MKPHTFVLAIIAPGLLAGVLAACSTWPGHERQETGATRQGSASQSPPIRGPGASAGCSGMAGSTGSGRGSGLLGPGMTGDQAAMCELNRRISSARNADERASLLERYLPGMSPDMREQHLEMMRERCR